MKFVILHQHLALNRNKMKENTLESFIVFIPLISIINVQKIQAKNCLFIVVNDSVALQVALSKETFGNSFTATAGISTHGAFI